jgi:hypothetical protein
MKASAACSLWGSSTGTIAATGEEDEEGAEEADEEEEGAGGVVNKDEGTATPRDRNLTGGDIEEVEDDDNNAEESVQRGDVTGDAAVDENTAWRVKGPLLMCCSALESGQLSSRRLPA